LQYARHTFITPGIVLIWYKIFGKLLNMALTHTVGNELNLSSCWCSTCCRLQMTATKILAVCLMNLWLIFSKRSCPKTRDTTNGWKPLWTFCSNFILECQLSGSGLLITMILGNLLWTGVKRTKILLC
jgi:hypothetical protein